MRYSDVVLFLRKICTVTQYMEVFFIVVIVAIKQELGFILLSFKKYFPHSNLLGEKGINEEKSQQKYPL